MANILILQEEPSWQDALRICLLPHHTVEFFDDSHEAILQLQKRQYDLVITRIHFKSNDVFKFLKELREEPMTKDVPVLCFCGLRTRTANLANAAISKACHALGATKFMSIEEFCTIDTCDLEKMRKAIESVIQ